MYCNPDRVIDKMPGAYPNSWAVRYPDATDESLQDLWRAKVEAEIAHYSRYIDDGVGTAYPRQGTLKFPSYNADPATPAIISEICYALTIVTLMSLFQQTDIGERKSPEQILADEAQRTLDKIRGGEIAVVLPTDAVTSGAVKTVTRTNRMTEANFYGFRK